MAGRPAGAEPLGTLLLTHSSRRTNPARCSVEFLTRRFADPERLRDLPPFDSLPPACPLYSGALSVYRVERTADGRLRLRRLGRFKSRDKIQHATVAGDRHLLVGFEHRIERWRLATPLGSIDRIAAAGVSVEAVVEHPHLAGLHTVEPLAGGRAVVSSAAADAALVLDLATGAVERTLRPPASLYGAGYELTPERDLRRHYVDDERQATHLNAAYPDRRHPEPRRLVVSALITGAVGTFDFESGGYRELVGGYVGCHGARFDDRGGVYFTDSARGALVRLDGAGRVARRFEVGSHWLHDAVQVSGPVFAFALADANELRLYDLDRDRLLWRERFLTWPFDRLFALARRWPGWLGNSTQALAFHPA